MHTRIPACRGLTTRVLSWLVVVAAVGCCPSGRAQWLTQTNSLKAGWNSVYLHVDASHTNLSGLVGVLDPIEEIWLWTYDLPPGLSLATPPAPNPGSRWSKWTRGEGTNAVLQRLPGNSAMLVRVRPNVANFAWRVKGRPVQPNHRWSLSGLNFVGFPSAGTNFEAFFAADAQGVDWKLNAELFRYVGGELGPTNPISLAFLLRHPTLGAVTREEAYWVRAGDLTNQLYNHYFGSFEITGADAGRLRFGDSQGQTRLRLKNRTRGNLTVTLRELPSEAPPGGPTPALLPLMVRGPLLTNLTFSYSSLAQGPSRWTLAPSGSPGSEAEIVLGVDRSLMGTSGGTEFAGVLRFTDSLGLLRVDMGASATTPLRTGLWVGNALVDQVSQELKPYTQVTNAFQFHERLNQLGLTLGTNNPSGTNVLRFATSLDGRVRYEWDTNTGRVLVFGTNANNGKVSLGSYLLDGPIRLAPDSVARPFPLRLIIHHNGATAKLMQRAYLGRDQNSNTVVAARQSALLAGDLANTRRLSAVHLPTSDGIGPWDFTGGGMEAGSTLQTTIALGHADPVSNPFLHTYHPDHDNRDALYSPQPLTAGRESYGLQRVMRLTFATPGSDFDSRTRGGTSLSGNYFESVSLRGATTVLKEFNVLGTFTLTRITDTANYAQQ
jgi:hypothetical protein